MVATCKKAAAQGPIWSAIHDTLRMVAFPACQSNALRPPRRQAPEATWSRRAGGLLPTWDLRFACVLASLFVSTRTCS